MIKSQKTIRRKLDQLSPEIPWTHHFNLNGVETITPEQDEKFYKKSTAAKRLGELALTYYQTFSEGLPLSKARILDVASAEGAMSVAFSQAGAKEVVGVEGRKLYIDRGNLALEVLGIKNVRYIQGDVRKLDPEDMGTFDFVINSGILHHLGQDDFFPFLSSMAAITKGTMFLYTHVSTPKGVVDFRLKGPVKASGEFDGYLLQEHKEDATPEERERQVRASLDNTYSFWADEENLIRALKKVGFKFISKVFEPHAFAGYENRNLRVIYIAKK